MADPIQVKCAGCGVTVAAETEQVADAWKATHKTPHRRPFGVIKVDREGAE